jgi:hypothetical protein
MCVLVPVCLRVDLSAHLFFPLLFFPSLRSFPHQTESVACDVCDDYHAAVCTCSQCQTHMCLRGLFLSRCFRMLIAEHGSMHQPVFDDAVLPAHSRLRTCSKCGPQRANTLTMELRCGGGHTLCVICLRKWHGSALPRIKWDGALTGVAVCPILNCRREVMDLRVPFQQLFSRLDLPLANRVALASASERVGPQGARFLQLASAFVVHTDASKILLAASSGAFASTEEEDDMIRSSRTQSTALLGFRRTMHASPSHPTPGRADVAATAATSSVSDDDSDDDFRR